MVVIVTLLCCCNNAYAQLYKPSEPLTVDTWVGGSDAVFTYPELGSSAYSLDSVKSKRRLGIALSGGSSRAAALSLGWMRALHQLGVTKQAGYLASNSGSSWFSAPFSFQNQYPVEKFLGPYIPPDQLSVSVLDDTGKGTSGSFASVISKAEVVRKGLLGKVGFYMPITA